MVELGAFVAVGVVGVFAAILVFIIHRSNRRIDNEFDGGFRHYNTPDSPGVNIKIHSNFIDGE